MRRRAVLLLCGLLLLSRATLAFAQTAEERAIDPARSTAKFGIAHIFVARVTGSIPILSGSVEIPAGSTIPLGASATLDATKIDSGDRDRDRSLEGPDYFDAQRFPTWTFTSTRVVPGTAGAFGMDGTLTIHGVAQPVHLDVTVRGDAANPVYHAVGRVDRRGFGMKGTRLDAVIGTTADITLDVTLK